MTDGRMQVVAADALVDAQRAAAAALRRRGLGRGDRVALVARGSADYLAVVLGALRSGVVPVPLEPGLTARERDQLLADADPALVLTGAADLAGLLAGSERDDLAAVPLARPMHYTSGTTGRPKGVWSGILAADEAAGLAAEERELWQLDHRDRHLVLSPLHHSAPLRFAIGTLLAGGSVLLPGPFDAERVWQAVAELRPTTSFCVPSHLQRLFAHPPSGRADLSCFRMVAHAGAPCPSTLKRQALALFPAGSVWEFYGSTEGQFTACRAEEWLERPGTVGRARPGRTLTVDDSGHIWCQVPTYARFEYWRDPVKTAGAWRGDRFTVGDLGRLDADGYLYLDGRRDDLIISGGVNVYPAEVEEVLHGCPGVEDVAVFGVDDERWGQRVCAAVVGAADETVLRPWASERLAPAKRPKAYVTVASLPRTATGKVRRLDLPALTGLGG